MRVHGCKKKSVYYSCSAATVLPIYYCSPLLSLDVAWIFFSFFLSAIQCKSGIFNGQCSVPTLLKTQCRLASVVPNLDSGGLPTIATRWPCSFHISSLALGMNRDSCCTSIDELQTGTNKLWNNFELNLIV